MSRRILNIFGFHNHTDTFQKIKDAISQDCLLQFYDMSKPLFTEYDASKKGLGCILLQPVSEVDEKNIVNTSNMTDILSDLKIIAYASKSLNDAETIMPTLRENY